MTKRKTFDPHSVPLAFWRGDDVQTALARHDVGNLFQTYLTQFPDCTQTQLALLTEHDRSDISNWVRGVRSGRVGDIDVLTRIADGLHMPDEARVLTGLAPASVLMSSIQVGVPRTRRPADSTQQGADDQTTRPGAASIYSSQDDAAQDIRQAATSANHIDVLAVRGLGLLGHTDSLLRTALALPRAEPLIIRVLILDADCEAAAQRAGEIGESAEAFAASIRFAEHKLKDLSVQPELALSAYRYTALPVWRVIATDDTAFVSTFDESWEGHASPVHRIDLVDVGALFNGFRRMLNNLVDTAEQFI